jgi:hypothetical protein
MLTEGHNYSDCHLTAFTSDKKYCDLQKSIFTRDIEHFPNSPVSGMLGVSRSEGREWRSIAEPSPSPSDESFILNYCRRILQKFAEARPFLSCFDAGKIKLQGLSLSAVMAESILDIRLCWIVVQPSTGKTKLRMACSFHGIQVCA